MPFTWQSRVRLGDTETAGRIHYTAVLGHCEAAEFEFMRALGHPYSSLEGSYPRVRVECDYLSALISDDLISTVVTVDRVGSSSYTLAFAVSVEGRAAAKGKITVVCIDRKTSRPRALPESLAQALRGSV